MRHKRKQLPSVPMAILVADTADGRKDKKIPREEAIRLYKEGKLVQLEIGPAYPWAFMDRRVYDGGQRS